jgi:1,3-beta-galactosyl-N-acetylhexosamine phosphorylase
VLQLAGALGVEKETGFTLGYDKYNWDEEPHFITAEVSDRSSIDFGEGTKSIYALAGTQVLSQRDKEVQLAANTYGKGRTVYMGGLPYSPDNARLLHRALLWASKKEGLAHTWFSQNPCVDVHTYPDTGLYAVCNNTYEPQSTIVYTEKGCSHTLELEPGELRWYRMEAIEGPGQAR